MATSPTSKLLGVTEEQRDTIFSAITESLARSSGMGSRHYVMETVLSQHDRFGTAPIQTNSEMVGLTFFTRPRLNMTTSSLRQDPKLAMMDTLDPNSLMFSLRTNLDSVLLKSPYAASAVRKSPWINPDTPFNVPLSNMLLGMSGWPDFNVEYETTEAGYFSEDMTMVRGSDMGRRTYDIQCTFRDVQGGYLMAYIFYWLHAMALQMEGAIVAYPDDREANRLNYTCSIYRFVLDPHMGTIVKWAKATGCYPASLPLGDVFNFGPGDSQIHTSQQFTVPFVVNNVSYMDPRHLAAFNKLVRRYSGIKEQKNGSLKSIAQSVGRVVAPITASSNFTGIPYIDLYSGTNELGFLSTKEELFDPTDSLLSQIKSMAANVADQVSSKYTKSITSS